MKLLVLTMFGQLLQQNIRVNSDFMAGGPCQVLTIELAICETQQHELSFSVQTHGNVVTILIWRKGKYSPSYFCTHTTCPVFTLKAAMAIGNMGVKVVGNTF